MSNNGNFYQHFARRLRENPLAACLEDVDGTVLTRAWLDTQSARYAHALTKTGCMPGDRIAVQVEKSPQALALYLAGIRAGLIFLPLNTAYQPAELAYLLADAQPRIFISCSENPEVLKTLDTQHTRPDTFSFDEHGNGTLASLSELYPGEFLTLPRHAEEGAALLYTSGTMGRPKGAILSHRAMSYCALTLMKLWQVNATDVLLHALPIFHGHGLFVAANLALVAGAKLIFLRRFEVTQVLDMLPRSTVFMGVPTFYHRLLENERLTPSLCQNVRLFISGSAPLAIKTHKRFQACSGHRIIERYGTTETMILCSNPVAGERRPGSVGLPLPKVALRIADATDQPLPTGIVGMIQVHSPGLFNGYWNQPEQTRQEFSADGYFRTGDLGYLDAAGYLTITSRAKDLIISGGYNVYPAEVEATIDAMDAVRESAVVATAHADFGEAVVAFIVPANSSNPPEPAQIMQWCKQRLANYKLPKQIHLIDELPRNTMGKILKSHLRELAATSYSRRQANYTPSPIQKSTMDNT